MPFDTSITPERIAETERLIRPHIRHTPIVHVDLADFGTAPSPVALKLESLQHSGSFKVRGAFANLLTRPIPASGTSTIIPSYFQFIKCFPRHASA